MSVAEILKVLASLDVKNDEHWTENGAPRLDVVQSLYPGITREHLVRAAPKFARGNPELPDLEKLREEVRERIAELDRKATELKELQATEKLEMEKLDSMFQQVKDSHSLTRANQTWIAAQNKVQLERMNRAKVIDQLVADAGGAKAIGKHPVEVNTAARIKAERKAQNKNFVVKT